LGSVLQSDKNFEEKMLKQVRLSKQIRERTKAAMSAVGGLYAFGVEGAFLGPILVRFVGFALKSKG